MSYNWLGALIDLALLEAPARCDEHQQVMALLGRLTIRCPANW